MSVRPSVRLSVRPSSRRSESSGQRRLTHRPHTSQPAHIPAGLMRPRPPWALLCLCIGLSVFYHNLFISRPLSLSLAPSLSPSLLHLSPSLSPFLPLPRFPSPVSSCPLPVPHSVSLPSLCLPEGADIHIPYGCKLYIQFICISHLQLASSLAKHVFIVVYIYINLFIFLLLLFYCFSPCME